MRNLITDVAGLAVGNAEAMTLGTGVTVAVFEEPAVASIAIHGGAPGVRDTALLEPGATVERVDALVLSGGSAFGLDTCGGVMAHLSGIGRGFEVRVRVSDPPGLIPGKDGMVVSDPERLTPAIRVPIVPGAVIFDLAAGGAAHDPNLAPWWELGRRAAAAASSGFKLGTVGAGTGATTANVKGGLGSASAKTADGFTVGALVAVNAFGSVLIGDGPHFWAATDEVGEEFGGRGWPAHIAEAARAPRLKGDPNPRANTTIAIVATDAVLSKAEARRVAVMAHDGMARAVRPAHAPLDGDVVFAAATGGSGRAPDLRQLTLIGHVAATTLARAIARGVYEATALPFPGAQAGYRDRFGG